MKLKKQIEQRQKTNKKKLANLFRRNRAASAKNQQYIVDDFEKQAGELNNEQNVLKSIDKVTDEKEQKALLKSYFYAQNSRKNIRANLYHSNKAIQTNSNNTEHHKRVINDNQISYEFVTKLINAAGTDPQKILTLKEKITVLNNAIKDRNTYRAELESAEARKLENTKNLKALSEKTSKLNALPDGKKKTRLLAEAQQKQKKLDLESNQQDRRISDASVLHDFSNALIKKASETADTSKLPEQFEALAVAANFQTKLRNELDKVEKQNLKNTNDLDALNKKITNLNNLPESNQKTALWVDAKQKKRTLEMKIKTQQTEIADKKLMHGFSKNLIETAAKENPFNRQTLTKKINELEAASKMQNKFREELAEVKEKTVETINKIADINKKILLTTSDKTVLKLEQEKNKLQLKQENQKRKISDKKLIHKFSNQLIEAANKPPYDTAKLNEQLAALAEISKKQTEFRRKIGLLSETILKLNNGTNNDLEKKQLNRQKDDVTMGHAMLNELIVQAVEKGDATVLAKQYAELKAGLDLHDAIRKNLEKIEKKYHKIELSQAKNNSDVKNFEASLLSKIKKPENNSAPNVKTSEELGKKNLSLYSEKDIEQIKKLSIKKTILEFNQNQFKRRKENANNDYQFSKQILEHAQKNKDFSQLPQKFSELNSAIVERDKITSHLETIEKDKFTKELERFSAELKLLEIRRLIEIEKKQQPSASTSTEASVASSEEKSLKLVDLESTSRHQEWEINKLDRRAKETEARDKKRLENAEKYHKEAIALLGIIANPAATSEAKADAQQKLNALPEKIEQDKRDEEALSPPKILKERDRYRNNLEKAEERELKNLKALAKFSLKNQDSLTPDDLAQKENLNLTSKQITREKTDTELMYNLSNEMILGIKNADDASVVTEQLNDLKVIDKQQKNIRKALLADEKNLLKADQALIKNAAILGKNQENIDLMLENQSLVHSKTQATRRVRNTNNDYNIVKPLLDNIEKTQKTEPGKLSEALKALKSDYEALRAGIEERNKLTTHLEAIEQKQFEKKNALLKETLKLAEIQNLPADAPNREYQIKHQTWKVDKLKRRFKEDELRDARRLKSATRHEEKANALLKKMADPNISEEAKKLAETKLKEIKGYIKAEQEHEKKLSPPEIRKERAQYRKNLEKAEELELKRLEKGESIPERTARRKKDTELMYNFANTLMLDVEKSNNLEEAAKLPAKFKELKIADARQRSVRKDLAAVERELERAEKLKTKNSDKLSPIEEEGRQNQKIDQLTRRKDHLTEAHSMMQALIKTAYDNNPPDPTGLATQCNNLREGIGGTRKYTRRVFGQQKNIETLEKTERKHFKNEMALAKTNNNIDFEKDEKKKALLLKKQEKRSLATEQSERRVKEKTLDYQFGKELLELAKSNPPKSFENLKSQFKSMDNAIKERNKFTKILEKAEKADLKHQRNVKKTEKTIAKENQAIEKLQKKLETNETALQKNPNDPKLLKEKAKLEKAINKKQNKIGKLHNNIEHKGKVNEANLNRAKTMHEEANVQLKNIYENIKNNISSTINSKDILTQNPKLKIEKTRYAPIELPKPSTSSPADSEYVSIANVIPTTAPAPPVATTPKLPTTPAPQKKPGGLERTPLHPNAIRIECGVNPSETPPKQAAASVQHLLGCNLNATTPGQFQIKNAKGVELGTLALKTDNGVTTMTANSIGKNHEEFMKVVATFAAHAKPDNPGTPPDPIVTLGTGVDPTEEKQIKDLFTEKRQEAEDMLDPNKTLITIAFMPAANEPITPKDEEPTRTATMGSRPHPNPN